MLALLALLLPAPGAAIRLVAWSGAPGPGILVREGDTARLSCTADKPWFLCQWLSPSGDKSCAIRDASGAPPRGGVCPGPLLPEGGPLSCSITLLRAGLADRGNWTCVLQDSDDLSTARRTLVLEVGRRARLRLTVEGQAEGQEGALGPLGWSQGGHLKGNVVSLREGQQVGIRCDVTGAQPEPSVEWRGPEGAAGRAPSTGAEGQGWPQDVSLGPGRDLRLERKFDRSDLSYSRSSVLSYRAEAWHNNRSLACLVTQRDENGTVLYNTTSSLFLQVTPLPPPLPPAGELGGPVGLIVGLLVAGITLLVLLVLLVVCLVRRRRRKKATGDEPDVATPGPAEGKGGGAGRGPGAWLRLTSALRPPGRGGGGPRGTRPSQGRRTTLSPIPGSVQSGNSRPVSRTSASLQGSRTSLASNNLNQHAPQLPNLGSRTSINTQQSEVNMAPGREQPPPAYTAALSGADSTASLDETEML